MDVKFHFRASGVFEASAIRVCEVLGLRLGRFGRQDFVLALLYTQILSKKPTFPSSPMGQLLRIPYSGDHGT